MGICQYLLERLKIKSNFLDKVIAGDESWVLEYDSDAKCQSEEWYILIVRRKCA